MKKIILAGLALGTAFAAMPAWAQVQPGVVSTACCRCTDGSRMVVPINTGQAGWRVTSPTGAASMAQTIPPNAAWGAIAPASWVGIPGASAAGNYTYELRINVPRCTIGTRPTLSGRFLADNSATVFIVNSSGAATQIAVSAGAPGQGFRQANVTPFSTTLTAGSYTLRVVVRNNEAVTGLLLQGAVTTVCPASPLA